MCRSRVARIRGREWMPENCLQAPVSATQGPQMRHRAPKDPGSTRVTSRSFSKTNRKLENWLGHSRFRLKTKYNSKIEVCSLNLRNEKKGMIETLVKTEGTQDSRHVVLWRGKAGKRSRGAMRRFLLKNNVNQSKHRQIIQISIRDRGLKTHRSRHKTNTVLPKSKIILKKCQLKAPGEVNK